MTCYCKWNGECKCARRDLNGKKLKFGDIVFVTGFIPAHFFINQSKTS